MKSEKIDLRRQAFHYVFEALLACLATFTTREAIIEYPVSFDNFSWYNFMPELMQFTMCL